MTNLENPTADDLTAAAEGLGIGLSDERATLMAAVIAESLDAFRFVETNTPRRNDAAGRSPGAAPDEADNPHNAWVTRGSIRTSVSGPLAGRTVAVKNSVAVAGWPMANGTDALANFVPSEDAVVVQRVLDAGAEIIGTSRCEFLCASAGSHTSAGGPVRNPHDPTRMAGGSSSGSAALVASGHVDLAIGGDQGGSVRMPSSFSGTVGMKPTHGLVPYTGAASIEATVDHLGPITATVADNAQLLDVLAGHDPEAGGSESSTRLLDDGVVGLKVGVVSEGFGADDGVDARIRDAAHRLSEDGASIAEVSVPMHEASMAIFLPIVLGGFLHDVVHGGGVGTGRADHQAVDYVDALQNMSALLHDAPANVVMVTLLGEYVRSVSGYRHYALAQQLAPTLRGAYDEALDAYDVLVMPTTPTTAPPIPDLDDDLAVIGAALGPLANTAAFDVTGHPALSVPVGTIDALPVGMMIIGRHHDEATIYRAAAAVEAMWSGADG